MYMYIFKVKKNTNVQEISKLYDIGLHFVTLTLQEKCHTGLYVLRPKEIYYNPTDPTKSCRLSIQLITL